MKWVFIIVGMIVGMAAGIWALEIYLTRDLYWVPVLLCIILGTLTGGMIWRRFFRPSVVEQQDFGSLPVSIAEFVLMVIKKMRYRRKVRADVQAELIAHFEDELKDCKTDEEKQQKAGELIEQFGDVKLLGVLLRRAKKRCRPLWRTVVVRTFQAAGVLILCLIVYVAWFFSGKPVVTVDYVAELNKLVRPAADDSLNAMALYGEAAELCKKIPSEISELVMTKRGKEVSVEDKQLLEEWLNDNEEIFDLIAAGTDRPYCWQTYSNRKEEYGMMGILMPYLAEFRKLARSLRWRAQFRAEQGRYEDAFDDIKVCYRFGQHLKGDKTIIEQLVGIYIEALAVRTLRGIVYEHRIDSATLAVLQKEFEQMVTDEKFTISIIFEKLTKYDEIQRCFTEDRLGGHISLEGLRRQLMLAGDGMSDFNVLERFLTAPVHILFTHPNKQESREMVERYEAYWEKIFHKSPARIQAEDIDVNEEAEEIVKGNILLEILATAYGRVHEISYRIRTDVGATLAILAALRYKEDMGNYPDNLNELVTSGYLKELPIDSFSDKPLVYKRTDEGFILYSFGLNFEDDGGDRKGRVNNWTDEGDVVFWPIGNY